MRSRHWRWLPQRAAGVEPHCDWWMYERKARKQFERGARFGFTEPLGSLWLRTGSPEPLLNHHEVIISTNPHRESKFGFLRLTGNTATGKTATGKTDCQLACQAQHAPPATNVPAAHHAKLSGLTCSGTTPVGYVPAQLTTLAW